MRSSVISLRNLRVGVVGLGYVGLPLAVEFGRHFRTVGFDIKAARIAELRSGRDSTLEVDRAELKAAKLLGKASETVGRALRKGAVVVAVGHREFPQLGSTGVRRLCRKRHVVCDIKHLFPAAETDGRL